MASAMNYQQALMYARAQLEGISDAPDIDAQRLLLTVINEQEPSLILAHPQRSITKDEQSVFRLRVAQRRKGIPLAYIVGEAEFYGRAFTVTSDVLIPRPETEVLVDHVLDYIRTAQLDGSPFVIADVGTGSGAIAITLACELDPQSKTIQIIATDISSAALTVARRNAATHGVSHMIEFLEGDMLEPLKDRHIDLIVSNPPYVPTAELDKAPTAETRGLAFEPRIALDGGPDGQQFVEQLKTAGVPMIIETTGGVVTNHLLAAAIPPQ